jgi:YVTN family beta-propeller protein
METNTAIATLPVGNCPYDISVNPTWPRAYVANYISDNVSVINTNDQSVITTLKVGKGPYGITVNPKGNRIYVTNAGRHMFRCKLAW